ncbi:MAG: hypothetical protein OXG24_02640 [Gammaproteobacteria bacterium]|nr:hypothetical protein [Gammaproteobacteria bacterium]
MSGIVQKAYNDHEVQVVLTHNAMSYVAKLGELGIVGSVLEALVFDENGVANGLISNLEVQTFSPIFKHKADYEGIRLLARRAGFG